MKIKSLKSRFFSSGFTLIELLIVIAILGVLAAGVVVAVDPLTKINSANLAKAKTFAASIQNSLAIDLVGEWTFNDGTAKDTSGYGNNGNPNAITWKNNSDCGLGLGGCASFDGTSSYISLPQIFSGHDFTVEFWVKRENGATYTWPHILNNNGWTGFLAHGHNATGNLWIGVHQDSGIASSDVNFLPAGEWVYVTYTRSTTQRLYRNGVYYGQAADIANTWGATTQITANGASWKGLIDEVRIYSKVLLSSQIKQLYAQGLMKHLLADSLHGF